MQSWYYIWWIDRAGGGQWNGPKLLGDEELWRYEYDVERGTPGVRWMYRWFWTGTEWQYDTRSAYAIAVRAGQQRLAWFP